MSEQTAPRARTPSPPGPLLVALEFVGESWTLAAQALAALVTGHFSVRHAVAHMASLGVGSLPIVGLTTFSTGAVMAFYVTDIFSEYGGTMLVGGTLALAFFLELGPVLCGVGVAARSGAAIAAEIGSMVVTEQVDALRALAVPPVRYLVAPRVLACVIMLPLVGIFADIFGLLGSYLMAVANGMPGTTFLESVRTYATFTDVVRGLIKTVWFGFTISVVACHQGLKTSGGATGVGRSVTRSVVLCVVLIFISDFFLAQVLSGPAMAQ